MYCSGCKRTDLTLSDFHKDSSKPSGHHSRCRTCKNRDRAYRKEPQPTRVAATVTALSPRARIGRKAVEELVRRHRLEFADIIAELRKKEERQTNAPRWVRAS
jgi:hypothetical protein